MPNSILDKIPPSLHAIREKFAPLRNVNDLKKESLSIGDRIALGATSVVGTMGFFFACMVMVTVPLLLPKTMFVIQYISSGYLQLILLPLIMVGQNLQSKHSEIRAENDYNVNMKAEKEIEVLFKHLEYQNAMLIALMKKLDVKTEDVLAISKEVYQSVEKLSEESEKAAE